MTFQGKKAIVTGANRSIGQEIAIQLAFLGADVAISYRSDEAGAKETVDQIIRKGGKAEMFYADFIKNENTKQFFDDAVTFLGGVDFLVNNAGMLARETMFEMTPEKMATVFQINTIAPYYLTQLCAKHMIEREVKGAVVNISSIAGTYTQPRGVAYGASKAAMNKWTQNVALNLAEYGIRVNTVAPGVVEAGMNAETRVTNPKLWESYQSEIPLQRAGTPSDISAMVTFLLSEKASWITGKIYEVDGGHVL